MRWMEERGRGHPVNGGTVPIIPAAVVFDLVPLGRFGARPTPAMAYDACESATSTGIAEGSVGAGTGATVGKAGGIAGAMKGGVGIGTARSADVVAAAVAVVNALGDVRDETGAIIAGARGEDGQFIDGAALIARGGVRRKFSEATLQNTTIAVVATNVPLARVELSQLAQASAAALFRRITPTGTSFDGDVIFAVCPVDGPTAPSPQVEGLAVSALELAVERAVRLAVGRDGIPGLAGVETGS
jgi:L-aminopeptidase/D-esterase-like protein